MFDFTKYQFNYGLVAYGAAIPLAIGILLALTATWLKWRPWVNVVAAVAVAWSLAALFVTNVLFGINTPVELPTSRFLTAGSGRVLDVGAGAGRAAIGVLLEKPDTTVVGLDLYDEQYWPGNTPERFMKNADIAGVAARAEARRGDMRALPFPDASFDAVISSYAIDHVNRTGRAQAIAEVARVLKGGGEFLLMIVNVEWWTLLISPPIAHHPRQDPAPWRALLEETGFTIEEEGTPPATRFWMARKRGAGLGIGN